MKKHIFIIMSAFFNVCYSQVGIGTDAPKASLEITQNGVGSTVPSGVLIPRMTGDQISAMTVGTNHNSMLVYATSAAASSEIDTPGFWYYDSANTVWKPLGAGASEKYFYMPSFNLPMATVGTDTFEIYDEYSDQFTAAGLDVYDETDITFRVTYYDPSIIDNISITNGTMSYEVITANPPAGSFVNIIVIVN